MAGPRPSGPALGALASLVGPSLVRANQNSALVSTSAVSEQIVGIYFSASWCPPCRQFTPVLASIYKAARLAGKAIEIVWVSSDRTAEDFQSYGASMPWLAVPFGAPQVSSRLSSLFAIRGIPSLVIVDARDGKILERQGVEKVRDPMFVRQLPLAEDPEIRGLSLDNLIEAICVNPIISLEQRLAAFKLFIRIISNIVQNPGEQKYLRLKKNNTAFKDKILFSRDLVKLLKFLFFKEENEAFVCSEFAPTDKLKEIRDVLHSLVVSIEGDDNQ
eukprot:GHVT01044299.1.p1 GENE.GHVT01044299.1~~GHVT01044299.1.p1  ORF type:complete len:274 (-),score=57.19 GHVT01044299.1:449-1270(-)